MESSKRYHLPQDAQRRRDRTVKTFRKFCLKYNTLLKHGYTVQQALLHPDYKIGKNITNEANPVTTSSPTGNRHTSDLRIPGKTTARTTSTTKSPKTSWAVIVLGYAPLLPNIVPVFQYCCQQLGRDRVIFIANFEEQHQRLIEAARTGYPVFSDSFSNQKNKLKQTQQLTWFRNKYKFVFDNGGADYDFERCNAGTLLRVLQGRKIHSSDKVIPSSSSLGSVFVCLNGHGDSARCLPRCSLRPTVIPCDLCNKPHQIRAPRIFWNTKTGKNTQEGKLEEKQEQKQQLQQQQPQSTKEKQFLSWMQDDFVPAPPNSMTNSIENDRNLDVGDPVITLLGKGEIIKVTRINTTVGHQSDYSLPTTIDPWITSRAVTFVHSYLYDIKLSTKEHLSDVSTPLPTKDPLFDVLGMLQSFSLIAHGKQQCPPNAAVLIEDYLGIDSIDLQHFIALPSCISEHNNVLKHCRRDYFVLGVHSSKENHYHSSLRTREWFFGMEHSTKKEKDINPLMFVRDDPYAFVASRYAGTDFRKYLFWQQTFQGLHAIRARSPQCKILCLMESCYSGGSIKFLKNDCAMWFNELASWPIMLIATAGEAQTSFGGQFLPAFLHQVKQGSEDGSTLMDVYNITVDIYNHKHQRSIHAGVRNSIGSNSQVHGVVRNHEINMSCSEGTGIGNFKIVDWFTRK